MTNKEDILNSAKNVVRLLTPEQIKDIKDNGEFSLYNVNGKEYRLLDAKTVKVVVGEDYNFVFCKITGDFKRFGKTYEDDPEYSPVSPEILDLEISVNGCPNKCPFCYKNNTNEPATNMSFDTFKKIVDSIPKFLTQIAFGITGVQTNPDFIKMMEYSRKIGIIPNFTLSGFLQQYLIIGKTYSLYYSSKHFFLFVVVVVFSAKHCAVVYVKSCGIAPP